MASMPPVPDVARHGLVLARFLERSQRHCFHELRGRLGTVVNFASVLESGQATGPETIDAAHRIRVNALTTVRMMQLLDTSIELAARPPRRRSTDLGRLAHVILTEAGGKGASTGREATADIDADLVAFVWRPFVAMHSDSAGCPTRCSSLSVDSTPGACVVVLQLAADDDATARSDQPEVDVQSYVCLGTGPGQLENALALTLAHHLVASHDGHMALGGRPGECCSLRLALPLNGAAESAL